MSEVSGVNQAVNAEQAARWNGPSGRYWIEHRERHLAEHQNLTPHLLRAAAVAPGERVLDVGCGCGHTTIAAARAAGGRGGALGLDLSVPMLEVARQQAAPADAGPLAFVRADAQRAPLRPGCFDAVISSFGVMFFADPAAAFTGLGAAARPGGRLAFLCWQDDAANEVFGIISRAAGQPPPAPGTPDPALFADPRRITDLLAGSGWDGVHVADVTEPAPMGSSVDDVMAYVRGMPRVRALLASLDGPGAAERALAAAEREYAARLRADGVWVRAAAWLVTARRV